LVNGLVFGRIES